MIAAAVFKVPVDRLAYGVWDHVADCERAEGDISASYSGDCIAISGTVRKPFLYQGSRWASVGGAGTGNNPGSSQCYRLVPVRFFDGEPTTYSVKVNNNPLDAHSRYPGDAARNDPNGFYHGMAVKHGPETLVLVGPPTLFTPDLDAIAAASQLSLF